MKINTTLPAVVSLSEGAYMAQIHTGIIQGWTKLPPDIQKLVEWAGAHFVPDTHNTKIQVDIKLNNEIVVDFSQVFLKPTRCFLVINSQAGIEQRVAGEFRETVLAMVQNLADSLSKHSTSLATLLK